MAFLCGPRRDDDRSKHTGKDTSNDTGNDDEEPTQPLPAAAATFDPEASVQTWPNLQTARVMVQRETQALVARNTWRRQFEFCPLCRRYQEACGIEDHRILLYPRPCADHAQAIEEAPPAERLWLHKQYIDAVEWFIFPPWLTREIDGWATADDDGSSADGNA